VDGRKEARLLREKRVSEDPARKHWVLSEEADAVPAERRAFYSGHSQHLSRQGKRNKTPVGTARDPKIHLGK